jgi:subtilisin-like proprotein convertase family protein
LSTTTNACPSANFTLSLQNATPGSGVTYQWQSADDAAFTVNVASLGTASTQVTSQTSAKYYRCQVTCTNSGQSAFSTPVLVNMGSTCFCSSYCATSNFGDGACITAVNINTLNSTTAACVPLPGYTFKSNTTTLQKGATYPLSVNVDANVYGGGIVSVWFDWNNDQIFDASEWFQPFTAATSGTINVTVPPTAFEGAIRMRVRSRGQGNPNGAGDACTVMGSGTTEDFCITITPPPPCAGTPSPGATVSSTASACTGVNFTLTLGNPNQGTGTTYQWQSGPTATGPWTNFGAGGPSQVTTQSGATWYQCVVTCTNSGQSATSTPVQVLQGGFCECGTYGAQAAGSTFDGEITNVTVGTMSNSSDCFTAAPGPGSLLNRYANYTTSVPAPDFIVGETIPFSVTMGTCGGNFTSAFVIFIDWNQDGDFDDAGERVFESTAQLPTVAVPGSFVVPVDATAGSTRMRVTMVETGDPTSIGPTSFYTWGETEDYCVNILDCTLPTVALNVVENCGNQTFTVDVNVTSFGFGTSGSMTYTVNGGSPVSLPLAAPGIETIGPFAVSDLVEVSVFNAFPVCGSTDGVAFSTCPVQLTCGTELLLYHCYGNNDGRTWQFVNPDNGTVSVQFFPGSLIQAGDGINFYDGAPGVNQIPVPPFGGDLANIGFYTSPGDVFSIEVDSDGSGSCQDGLGGSAWSFRVLCTPSCTQGEADVVDIDTDCANLQFSITLDYFFLGEIFNEDLGEFEGATEGGIRYIVDNGTPVELTGLVEDIYTIGPFPAFSSVQVYLIHETDALCDKFVGTFTRDELCPPVNNTCATATALTVQSPTNCPANATSGSTIDGTTIIGAPTCGNTGGGPFLDAWYSFNTGFNPLPITVNVTAGTATHLGWQVFPSCGGAPLVCSTAPSAQVPGLAQNTNYLVRVFTNDFLGDPGSFTICVSSAAPTVVAHNTCGQNLAIPDAGCFSNLFAVGQVTISGAPAGTMGTDVALQSVELITTHTWNGDLQIYLVSPGGQQIPLVLNRGGSADNFGNPALCPTATLILQDGAPPVSGLPVVNNVTGTFAPEQPLATFNTGTANGNWLVRICDSAGGDVGSLNFIKLNFVCLGVAATASNGGPYCTGETIQLNANTVLGNVFSWTGPGGFSSTLQNPTIPNALVANSGTYTCTVSSTLNPCPRVVTTSVTVNARPAAITNVGHYAICVNGTVPNGQGLTAVGTPVLATTSATYTAGVIPTPADEALVATCNGPTTPLTVNIPAGSTVVGTNVTYQFTAQSGAWTNEQRSRVACVQTGLSENGPLGGYFACGSPGSGAAPAATCGSIGGTLTYTRNGLSIANGVTPTGTLTFNLQAYRTWPFADGCNTTYGIIPNGTWTVTVQYLTPATILWYDAPVGGNLVGSGSPFDPVAANVVNPAVPGLYTLYATYSDGTCEANRTPVQFAVGDETALVEFYTDDFPSDLSWQIEDVATSAVLYNGQGFVLPPSATFQLPYCLPSGRCYKFRVTDSGVGSVGNPGYQVRSGNQARLIDNKDNFNFTGTSEITGNSYSFCFPVGTNAPIYTSCDKFFWRTGEYLVADEDVDVSAVWIPNGANNVQSANTGYEFWFFNPNGGYSFRRFRSHNQSDGFGNVGATRACHMRVNNWAVAQHIPEFNLHNVRIRARVNGVNKPWGPACRFVRNEALAQCPPTKLMDIPGNQFLSCNQFRQFVSTQRVHARPVSGANRYEWRFRIPAENVEIIRTSTTYFLNLGWGPLVAAPLQNGKTYEVDVRASKDGGITWCGLPGDPWGDVCLLTIGTPPMQGGGQNLALAGNELLNLWPNPNSGDELWISLSEVAQGVETIAVDIHDLFGKRVSAQVLATQGDHVYTVMPLPADMASGVYTVSILAGEQRFTQRLVIAR